MREQILAVLLLLAAALIVAGVASFSPRSSLITAGLLGGLWSWLVLGDIDGDDAG